MMEAAFLDIVNIGCSVIGCFDIPCFFGGYEYWRLRFWMLQTLDASLLDVFIVPRCDVIYGSATGHTSQPLCQYTEVVCQLY